MVIILACSLSKLSGTHTAVNLYNTRQHRAVAAKIHNLRSAGCKVYILSAEYGLISAHVMIQNYNRKLTTSRARELLPQLRIDLAGYGNEEIVVYGGGLYRQLVELSVPASTVIHHIIGKNRGCGDHFSALQQFLAGYTADPLICAPMNT